MLDVFFWIEFFKISIKYLLHVVQNNKVALVPSQKNKVAMSMFELNTNLIF